jgi:hypothetical protein
VVLVAGLLVHADCQGLAVGRACDVTRAVTRAVTRELARHQEHKGLDPENEKESCKVCHVPGTTFFFLAVLPSSSSPKVFSTFLFSLV